MATATPTRATRGGIIVSIPGQPGEKIDTRVLPDVSWLVREFKVKVTDGYAPTGHAAGGEHPLGLAVDLVPDPARGGTWDDVDNAAKWAASAGFRFVGYDGRFGTTAWPGHGRGQHLHLSWTHDATGKPTRVTESKSSGGGGITGGTIASGLVRSLPVVGPVAGAIQDGVEAIGGDAIGKGVEGVGGVAGDAATEGVKAGVGLLIDAIGEDGGRALLYVLLVGAGVAFTVIGVARATGADKVAKAGAGIGLAAVTKGVV